MIESFSLRIIRSFSTAAETAPFLARSAVTCVEPTFRGQSLWRVVTDSLRARREGVGPAFNPMSKRPKLTDCQRDIPDTAIVPSAASADLRQAGARSPHLHGVTSKLLLRRAFEATIRERACAIKTQESRVGSALACELSGGE